MPTPEIYIVARAGTCGQRPVSVQSIGYRAAIDYAAKFAIIEPFSDADERLLLRFILADYTKSSDSERDI